MRNKILCIALLLPAALHAAATITILNNDSPGEGFNDPTVVAPIGGNPGTTLGQQRLFAFQHAASIWGAPLSSNVTIFIRASFNPLTCNATSAVLGSAGPVTAHGNFTGAPFTNTWYHAALANKLAGADLSATNPDISATFNSNLGQAGCLTGTFFYLGLDSNHGANIDLVAVLLHEFAHGLGFSTVTNGATGAQLGPPFLPSAFDRFLFDKTQALTWNNLTDAQRAASAINTGNLVWNGSNTVGAVPSVLSGLPQAVVTTSGLPVNVSGTYAAGIATFGAALTIGGVTADLMPVIEQGVGTGAGCAAFNAANTLAVNGKIALIDRGVCTFATKAKNAQNAGAIGVIIGNNTAGPAPSLTGSDPTITIPVLSLSQADSNTLKTALNYRSRTRSGVVTKICSHPTQFLGADTSNRPLMYAPNPFAPGSSVSHWDTSLFRNQLMEPFINSDLTHSVNAPQDLTFPLLKDIGWN